MRTIVDLAPGQVKRLDAVVKREGISRAEAVRRAIDLAYPVGQVRPALQSIRRRAFGVWAERKIDAVQYVDEMRGSWGS